MIADPQYFLFLSLLIATSLTLLASPFYPAWREWRHPTDDDAMVVVASQTRNIITIARQFREKILSSRDLPVFVTRAVSTFGAFEQKAPVYATDDLELRYGGKFTEVFSDGSLVLGALSRITGWAHSERDLEFGEGTVAIRQVSSAALICLARKCCFEQLHAPVIYFGNTAACVDAPKASLLRRHFSMEQVVGASPWGHNGWRVNGDCEIPAACCFKGSLVVTGLLTIGAGTLVEGDLKAYRGIFLGADAQVTGAVFCEGGIHISRNGAVGGPMVADTHLLIGSGSVLGSETAPTTVTAKSIIVGDGVVAHGTVWALQAGVVWGQA
jgi:cytoskeletal protein CcmA (bactofilin family)